MRSCMPPRRFPGNISICARMDTVPSTNTPTPEKREAELRMIAFTWFDWIALLALVVLLALRRIRCPRC